MNVLVGGGIDSLTHAALQFVLSHRVLSEPSVSTVIPGMRRREHVEANCRYSLGPTLSAEAMERVKSHAWARNFYD